MKKLGTFREYLAEDSDIIINITKEGLYDIELDVVKGDKSIEKLHLTTDKSLAGFETGVKFAIKQLGAKKVKINKIGFR